MKNDVTTMGYLNIIYMNIVKYIFFLIDVVEYFYNDYLIGCDNVSKSNWYALDNTAKIIPSMTTNMNTNVFRLVCSLYENIEPKILKLALSKTLKEFPIFLYQMKDGLFWHYLEKSNIEPEIEIENNNPCSKIDNGLLFKVSYYKKRINLEVYHVLADGNGAMEFLKYLVCTYINIKKDLNLDIPLNESSVFEKERDDFKRFDKDDFKIKISSSKRAYKFKFKMKDNIIHDVIEMHMSVKDIKDISKKYNVTLTVYLISLYIKSIIDNVRVKDLRKSIGISVPVDLRNIFPSKTSRNFFYTVLISYKYRDGDTFLDIIDCVNVQLKEYLKKDNLQMLLNSYMLLEKLIFIRLIPNFIKNWCLKIGIYLGKIGQTSVLSNLGIIKVPLEYEEYIESFSAISSTDDLQLTVCSFKDNLTLSFSSHLISKDIERTMLKYILSEKDTKVKVISNIMGGLDD